jgi:hypothetical protein
MADFLHKISWYFGSGTAEWNELIFGCIILFYIAKSLLQMKIQNGGYIQDGVEIFYVFHQIFSKILFFQYFLFTFG